MCFGRNPVKKDTDENLAQGHVEICISSTLEKKAGIGGVGQTGAIILQ